MAKKIDAIENALMYVRMDQPGMHHSILCKETGQIFYTSEMGDSDELPDDIDEPIFGGRVPIQDIKSFYLTKVCLKNGMILKTNGKKTLLKIGVPKTALN